MATGWKPTGFSLLNAAYLLLLLMLRGTLALPPHAQQRPKTVPSRAQMRSHLHC